MPTIDEIYNELNAKIYQFQEYWRENNQLEPHNFPLRMSRED